MVAYHEVRENTYFDSVTLMLFSSRLSALPGVKEAAVMMGTDHNKSLMIASGILQEADTGGITPNALVVGVLAEDDGVVQEVLAELARQFESKKQSGGAAGGELRVRNVDAAVEKLGEPNFAIVSLPGKYAKYETMKLMKQGVHVLLFSDNVCVEEENELKDYALEHGLLMMGPDCGTAIVGGVALGFANIVRRGSIGLVAAAGTGLQEATVIVDRLGGGVSQALGTGGRDLKAAVGGKMMLQCLDALEADPETKVVGIISKPPEPMVMDRILDRVRAMKKPVVACFLGGDPARVEAAGALAAATLEDAAAHLAALERGAEYRPERYTAPVEEIEAIVRAEAGRLAVGQTRCRGLYSGGTLCYEAMLLLQEEIGPIYSNIAHDGRYRLPDVERSLEDTLIDMGDDYFTDGMPHPMIDVRLRSERIKREAEDPETAVILLDCVLGYGCHEDPAGALAEAIGEARRAAGERYICFVASVCGTDRDAQVRRTQEDALRRAGVVVMPTNAQAARMAADILKRMKR